MYFIILENPYQLLKLVLNEADLVKVAAYKQLKILYKEVTICYYIIIHIVVTSSTI